MIKNVLKTIIIFAVIVIIGSPAANAEKRQDKRAENRSMHMGGPGPVESISVEYNQLPESIQSFVRLHFPSATATEIKLKTMAGVYKIDLSNGYELAFLKTGQWVKIEAPENGVIHNKLLKELLPIPAFNKLAKDKVTDSVEEIIYNPKKGFKVDMVKIKDYYFDLSGNSIAAPQKNKCDKPGKECKK